MTAADQMTAAAAVKSCPCCAVMRRGLLVLAAIVTVFGTAAWIERHPLLRWAADVWIVSDQPAAADAVAVFGGGLNSRPFAAAAYYKQGLVRKVLLSHDREGAAAQLGIPISGAAATRAVLVKLGVNEDDIETFGSGLANTHEEVLALREWAQRMQVRSIIVPTEIFSARRVRWMLHRTFGDDFAIVVPALDPPNYRRDDWWRHADGFIGFQNEVLKYIYYWLRY